MMNKNIYNSAFYSLGVQLSIAFLCVGAIFIKIKPEDQIINEILILETFVQLIEIAFYIWLIFQFSSIQIDVSLVRYFDWFITTPTMLFSLISFMIYYNIRNSSSPQLTKDLSVESIAIQHKNLLIQIGALNAIMLGFGLLGELKKINKQVSFGMGTIALLWVFYLIYDNFVSSNILIQFLFWFNFLVWAMYGVAYLLKFDAKNITYNILDVFSKNINGLMILGYIVYLQFFS